MEDRPTSSLDSSAERPTQDTSESFMKQASAFSLAGSGYSSMDEPSSLEAEPPIVPINRALSRELSRIPDSRMSNERIKKLIRDQNEQDLKSNMFPETSMTLQFTCADFMDALDSNSENWHAGITRASFQFRQLIKMNLGSRLAGDLGFLVYTRNGLGITNLTPRLQWTLGAGYSLSAAFQMGDKQSTTLSVHKNWEKLNLQADFVRCAEQTSAFLHAKYQFDSLTNAKLQVDLGDSPGCYGKAHKKINDFQVEVKGMVKKDEAEIQGFVSREIAKKVCVKTGLGVSRDGVKAGMKVLYNMSEYTSMGYSLEANAKDLFFSAKLKRGNVKFNFPLCLTHSLSRTGFLMGITLFGIMTVVTNKLYEKMKTTDPETNEENSKVSDLEELKKRAQEFQLMVAEKARSSNDLEQERNGLVILEAFYGKEEAIRQRDQSELLVDVTISLQFLVEDSKLYLGGTSKSQLHGFYNPMPGNEPCVLFVHYMSRGITYTRTFQDSDLISLP